MKKTSEIKLFLHSQGKGSLLPDSYERAFANATELFIVSAYLTNWSYKSKLNKNCHKFLMIVGKDFGLTRKAACEAVLKWVPTKYKVHFRVADQIDGFHPKAVFWREADGRSFAIIGSSNLSLAAFESNCEANVLIEIPESDFEIAGAWVEEIAELAVPVSKDWLDQYCENKPRGGKGRTSSPDTQKADVLPVWLPRPRGSAAAVRARRKILLEYGRNRDDLISLFRQCADGRISSAAFYRDLPNFWGGGAGGRIQGKGWERQGSRANFQSLAKSFVRVLDAKDGDRDDVVVAEMDRLARLKNPARKAFFSEMLCLEFPEKYPVLNKPVQRYLSDIRFRGAFGLSEGGRYLDLALRLRLSLKQNPKHPAKSLAELDTVIWTEYPPTPT
ncbi:hypothetical protein HKD42_00035 [Altererythrobacter sp. RZ02]|uniref:Phospholipase D-like domain-containing protein n=1 Tax=Pontixanthobacter rizhaonensis TaxID=2730337 RepID=A0A848QHI9_9SPHN|nr:phospholipase D family protein [Pontixanthobacter rizhaonensis]NMW30454.1 hypothetical protein [Pontixanthobacter rizhaonensis]